MRHNHLGNTASESTVPLQGPPRATFRAAEKLLLNLRALPPDMPAAVSAALGDSLCGGEVPSSAIAAGRAISEAVAAHAASFAPVSEPAYHDQRHQAEATIAMGWLCARAHRLGLLSREAVVSGLLAMAGHDLLHDGSWPRAGVLEARSADVTLALIARSGLDASSLAAIRRVILATDLGRPKSEWDADDLLCRLAQEADAFGSLTPELGWQLSCALAREADAASHRFDHPVASYAGRLALLRQHKLVTLAGRELGLDVGVADQIAALAVLGDGDPDRGASRLDALPPEQARADYLAKLAAVAPE